MTNCRSLNHTKWESKYHVVFIPKCRKKRICGGIRRYLGKVLRRLAEQRESRVEEGHLMPDHVHMMILVPPKYAVSQVIGYITVKSAIRIAREFAGRKGNSVGKHFWARRYYVTTVGRDEAVIQEYIRQKGQDDRLQEQLRLTLAHGSIGSPTRAMPAIWPRSRRLSPTNHGARERMSGMFLAMRFGWIRRPGGKVLAMKHDPKVYERAVLKRMKSACVDRTASGDCRHDPGLDCTIRAHMPRILQALRGVTSDKIDQYVERVRDQVCTACRSVDPDGTCDVRHRADCCLDRYLVLVVEAVEETERRLDSETAPPSP